MKYDLLSKTEMRIENIVLEKANLTNIAAYVADILGLQQSEVLVVDYRNEAMTLDILNTCVNAYNILGKKDKLLSTLGGLPGVTVSDETSIHSDGMLGWIAMDGSEAREALRRSEQMASEILKNISKRAIVFSTGSEVADDQIEDTNTPAIMERLEAEGFRVSKGRTLKDDKLLIAARLRQAVEVDGFGIVITTGGVGAEDKDHTVEAVQMVDPRAATPYICHFKVGTGRHVKDGIRIAVGKYNETMIVALPGPNDEVRASLDILIEGLKSKTDKRILAEQIAATLRDILREKMSRHE